MRFPSSVVRFLLLTASTTIPNASAFALHPRTTATVTAAPKTSSTSLNLLGLDEMREKLGEAEKLIHNIDAVEDYMKNFNTEAKRKEIEMTFLANCVSELAGELAAEFEAEGMDVDQQLSLEGGAKLLSKLAKDIGKSYGAETLEFSTYPAHPEFPTVSLTGLPKKLKGGPPTVFYIEKNVRLIMRFIKLELGLLKQMKEVRELYKNDKEEEAYKAFFSHSNGLIRKIFKDKIDLVPEPPNDLLETWEDDDEHGYQFLNGVNPVMIRVCKELGDLSDEITEKLGRDELQKLIDEKRLFYVSFDELAELKKNPHSAYPEELNPKKEDKWNEWRYFDPAIAVFVLSKDRETLTTKAIQLERKEDAKVYTNEKGASGEWMYAKARLATSDSNYHEWVNHLGMTHLAAEPHAIAAWNTLRKKNHKLYTFLEPLYLDTLALNWAARDTLAGYKAESMGDRMSSVGVGQYLQLLLKKWQGYNFFRDSGLPSELETRGFTEDFDLPCYYFREDGMKLWNAYGTFATEFVDECYSSDQELADDEDVQEWAQETSYADMGAVPGFPTSFTDKATLAKALQTIMWMTSGQHAAINFPQYDYYAFPPNKPLGGRASLEDFPSDFSEDEQKEWIFKNYFPDIDVTKKFQVLTTHLLTLPSTHTIGKLEDQFPGSQAYTNFQKELVEIGKGIDARNEANKKRNKPIYHYLHPDVVPASIDI